MRTPKLTPDLLALVAANLVPLFGVVFLHWDAAMIVLLYWSENLVIGFYNVLRMAFVRAQPPFAHLGKLFMILFFCVHFGGFCAGHGFFLLLLFKIGHGADILSPQAHALGPLIFLQLLAAVIARLWESRPPGMEWFVLCLLVSHGVSFVQNFVVGGEYRTLTLGELMGRPYSRVVVLHVAIIAGAMPLMAVDSPLPLLCILIGLKTFIDVRLHLRSHRAVDSEPAQTAA